MYKSSFCVYSISFWVLRLYLLAGKTINNAKSTTILDSQVFCCSNLLKLKTSRSARLIVRISLLLHVFISWLTSTFSQEENRKPNIVSYSVLLHFFFFKNHAIIASFLSALLLSFLLSIFWLTKRHH